MLPKSQRLDSGEVESVMTNGQAIFGEFFLVKFLKNTNKVTKISAIAPKKAFPTAVQRNKLRRRINSALFPILNKKFIKNSFLIAIVGNKKSLTAKIADISLEIEQVFTKGGIL